MKIWRDISYACSFRFFFFSFTLCLEKYWRIKRSEFDVFFHSFHKDRFIQWSLFFFQKRFLSNDPMATSRLFNNIGKHCPIDVRCLTLKIAFFQVDSVLVWPSLVVWSIQCSITVCHLHQRRAVINRIAKRIFTCLVDGGHRAVIFDRFQGVKPDVIGEGTHFMIPWLQRPIIFDIRTRPRSVPSSTGTKGIGVVNVMSQGLHAHSNSFRFAIGQYHSTYSLSTSGWGSAKNLH